MSPVLYQLSYPDKCTLTYNKRNPCISQIRFDRKTPSVTIFHWNDGKERLTTPRRVVAGVVKPLHNIMAD